MSVQSNPFKRTTIIIMFAIGFAAFVALLYGLGAGDRLSSGNNGRAHGASNSLVGYKALADLLEKTGRDVQLSRSAAGIDEPGLLIVTPNAYAEADKLAEVIQERAYVGPTMIILPKWNVATTNLVGMESRKGWAQRLGTVASDSGVKMLSEIVDVELQTIGPEEDSQAESSENNSAVAVGRPSVDSEFNPSEIASSAVGDPIPLPEIHITMTGDYVRNIVEDPENGESLIAYVDDGGVYENLESLDPSQITADDEIDTAFYPVVIVADADLMNNTGMGNERVARHAYDLITALEAQTDGPIIFDLTFNGLGSSDNLLTLAFKPPFLSATICLIIAALAAAWMAFNRFGPPVREQRSIDFGTTALVNNSAGFIHRMQRERLVADPYGEMIRSEAINALGLSPALDREELDHKLDMLGEVNGNRFSALLYNLNQAQNSRETADHAAALYNWKKELIG
ncbi:hypothetical protein GCM10009096_30490 [Parasphingorhabdus litoris]|uniref:DUF4350 domain-containing protein n=1 Tax=Parasphingorhabdus litoris TaxID=394733 RepID=A0ABN1AX41_9SPHN|nr:hypothetical protein [Parasphingorhabdus litoris]